MHAWIRRALCAAGLTGGIVLLGIGLAESASAEDTGPVTTGESGIASGNQTGVDAQAPINLSGNQVTVIGQDNTTSSDSGASTAGADAGSPTTSGEDGIASGNQTAVGVQAPVNASGNQVTVIGQDNQTQSTGSAATTENDGVDGGTTSGESGVAAGNQTGVDIQVPVNAAGNQVTVIGQDNAVDATGSSATAGTADGTDDEVVEGPVTSGEDGIIAGNQTGVAVLVPAAVTGNQVTVIGQDNTVESTGGSTTATPSGPGQTTSGEDGIGSGNQTPVTVLAPVDTSGNQVTVIGQDNTVDSTSSSTTTPGGSTTLPPGEDTTPPLGPVVSPPAADGPQAGPAPGAALPSTGLTDGLLGVALRGLLLLLLGTGLLRRGAAVV
ncbi:MAG TPA: chaplin family protein [Marmoricola sp.]